MIATRSPRRFLWIALIGAFSILLGACNARPPATPTDANGAATTQAATPTALPTATSRPPAAVLVAPEAADPRTVQALAGVLQELAQGSGLEFEQRQALAPSELDPAWKVVVVLPPDAGLAALAGAAPATQFVAVGIEGLTPGPNLNVIGPQGWREDVQAFVAGTIGAVTVTNWRTAVITAAGSPQAGVVSQAFKNGAYYFCGLCNPSAPPFVPYPQAAEIPSGADQAEIQAALDELAKAAVGAIYVQPAAATPELLEYAAGKALLIGSAPPPENLRARWIATVQADPAAALRELWPDLLQGTGGASREMPIVLADVQPDLLSAGRQALVQTTLDDLLAGWIVAGEVPAQ